MKQFIALVDEAQYLLVKCLELRVLNRPNYAKSHIYRLTGLVDDDDDDQDDDGGLAGKIEIHNLQF